MIELKTLQNIIAEQAPLIREVSDKIYHNPELGFKEHKAAAWQIELLKKWGFEVQVPVGGLETAFKASFGEGQPVFCFISEYDALPDTGHACGHNLIAATALAAGFAVRQLIASQQLKGKIVILGTPGEERLGGKVIMLGNGVFENIDACLISHPLGTTGIDPGGLSASRFKITFKGHASHAAAEPEAGINALDAIHLVYCGINAWRQQLPPDARVHGIITDGGSAPNIIPETAEAFFYVRAGDNKTHALLEQRFENIVKGAAMMSGTEYNIEKQANSYAATVLNPALSKYWQEQASTLGMEPQAIKVKISTDFGNISSVIPGANLFFRITRDNYPLHSIEFKAAAGTDFAFEQAMKTAAGMAATAVHYMTDNGFRNAVENDFQKRI